MIFIPVHDALAELVPVLAQHLHEVAARVAVVLVLALEKRGR